MRNVLLIDNYDSFSFNLVEALERLGCTLRVVRNSIPARTAITTAEQDDAMIVLSPGPGRPEDAGCCLELVALAKGRIPLLGICLGHQAIAMEVGQDVTLTKVVHGKSSLIQHDCAGPFEGLESPLRVGRYHSLAISDVPRGFRAHAEFDGAVMAMSDREKLQMGLQFHPESILTRAGDRILFNAMHYIAR